MRNLFDPRTFRLAFFATALLSTVAALMPSIPFEPNFEFEDKVKHFAIFALLAGLAWFGFPQAPRRLILERLSFLGAAIEVLQSIPALHRDCDVLDWATDTLAVGIALLSLARFLPRRRFGQG